MDASTHSRNWEDIYIRRSADETVPDVTFNQLYPMIHEGASNFHIRQKFNDLSAKCITKARCYYAAKVHPKPARGKLRVLCDENVSIRHLFECQKYLGYATSIRFENMGGVSDHAVWQFARDNHFDLIVTKDRRNRDHWDLTRIAANAWREAVEPDMIRDGARKPQEALPMLLHLTGTAKDGKKFGKKLRRNLRDVFAVCAEGRTPVVRLHAEGLCEEMGLSDLFAVASGPRLDTTRNEQFARKYLRRLGVDDVHLQDREDPQVKRKKRKVTQAIAVIERGKAAGAGCATQLASQVFLPNVPLVPQT